jgi:CheY-like chemotaxis protein
MQESAEHMAEINQDLLALGRRGVFNGAPVDLNDLVRHTIASMQPVPESLKIDRHLAGDLFAVRGAQAQLSRILTNLVVNAREAMDDAGTIAITTRNVYLDEGLDGMPTFAPGEYVLLEVRDTGPGIPADVQERVFDAFFTTKTSGRRRGAGLGLSVVQTIVEDHGGHIQLESRAGKGTMFRLYFPASRDSVEQEVSEELPRGRERVLVVDDDPLQREVVNGLLRYAVELASSGEQALGILRDHTVDLIVLDMVMPGGMDGADTFLAVKTIHPAQRVLILSGFAQSERVAVALAAGAGAFVSKPVSVAQLARAVRQVLDGVLQVASLNGA